MNKGRRQELTQLKFKKRIKHIGMINDNAKLFMFKSHGKPCSCWACRDKKYRDVDRPKLSQQLIKEI